MALVQPYANAARVSFDFWAQPVLQNDDGTYYCPGFEGPTYASDPWDFVYLGIPSTTPFTPGLARVSSPKWRDVDKKKAVGNDGATVTIHGADLADITIELIIWTPEQLRALDALWPILFPANYKGSPPAYDVQHPVFKRHGVKAVQFTGGDGPHIDQQRRGLFVMKAIEFAPSGKKKNTTKTETGSMGSLLDPDVYPTPGSNPANTGPG